MLPLYWLALDDAITLSPLTRDSLPRTSSAMPSAKYSSVDAPWFWNGSTAMRLPAFAAASPAFPAFPALPAITVAVTAHTTSAAAPAIARLRTENSFFGIASITADAVLLLAGSTSVAGAVTADVVPELMPACRSPSSAVTSAAPVA